MKNAQSKHTVVQVLVANPSELQQRIVRAGLPLTGLRITSVQPYHHETVPDQIAAKLSFWQRHAGTVWPALYTSLAVLLVGAGAWFKGSRAASDVGSSSFGNSSSSSSNASLPVSDLCCAVAMLCCCHAMLRVLCCAALCCAMLRCSDVLC